jgi:hypothetical protein
VRLLLPPALPCSFGFRAGSRAFYPSTVYLFACRFARRFRWTRSRQVPPAVCYPCGASTCSLVSATCYLLPATCYLLPATCSRAKVPPALSATRCRTRRRLPYLLPVRQVRARLRTRRLSAASTRRPSTYSAACLIPGFAASATRLRTRAASRYPAASTRLLLVCYPASTRLLRGFGRLRGGFYPASECYGASTASAALTCYPYPAEWTASAASTCYAASTATRTASRRLRGGFAVSCGFTFYPASMRRLLLPYPAASECYPASECFGAYGAYLLRGGFGRLRGFCYHTRRLRFCYPYPIPAPYPAAFGGFGVFRLLPGFYAPYSAASRLWTASECFGGFGSVSEDMAASRLWSATRLLCGGFCYLLPGFYPVSMRVRVRVRVRVRLLLRGFYPASATRRIRSVSERFGGLSAGSREFSHTRLDSFAGYYL